MSLGARLLSSEAPAHVLKLVDEIVQLNLMETKHLNELLRQRLDIPEFSMGAMPMAMPGAGAAADAEEEVADSGPAVQTKFTVKLVEFDKIIKIKLIKEIRAVTDMGLKEAKELVEKIPADVVKDVDKAKAEEIAKVLKEIGATVAIE